MPQFRLTLMQQDLNNLNNYRTLTVQLSSPRVMSPIPTKHDTSNDWLSTTEVGNFWFWGFWWPHVNSTTNTVSPHYTLGSANVDQRGWRASITHGELQFVENWNTTNGTQEIKPAAVLYDAWRVSGGFAPYGDTSRWGRGFVDIGSSILVKGSITWHFAGVVS